MPKLIKIDLVTTALSPLFITDPGPGYVKPGTLYVTDSKPMGETAFPCGRTKKMPFAKQPKPAAAAEGQEDETVRKFFRAPTTPILPANGLRGARRRKIADLHREAIHAKKQKISFDLWHILLCGAASTDLDKSATIAESAQALQNPFAALFGGGPKLIHSQLSTGNGFPISEDMIDAHIVPEEYRSEATNLPSYSLMVPLCDTKIDDFMRGTGKVPVEVESFDSSATAYLEKLQKSSDNKAAGLEGKMESLAGVHYKECVIPGVKFWSQDIMDIELGGIAMLGLYILGLTRFANEQRLGGAKRQGYGRFSIRAKATTDDSKFELLQNTDGVYTPNMNSPDVTVAVEAATKYLANITAEDLAKAFLFNGLKKAA